MPILTKEVEVKLNGRNVEHYKSLGYKIPMKKASKNYFEQTGKEFVYDFSKTITVKIDDLSKSSRVRIEVLCDMCNKNIIKPVYDNYNRKVKETGSYVCRDCSYKKTRNTLKDRYNVEYYSQSVDYKEKYHNTCIERYGEDYGKYIIKKMLETFRNETGYEFPSQSPEVREKITQTFIRRFGVSNPIKSPNVREKITQTFYANSSQKVSKQQKYI